MKRLHRMTHIFGLIALCICSVSCESSDMRAEPAYVESPLGYVPPPESAQDVPFLADETPSPTVKSRPMIIDRSTSPASTLSTDD